MNKKFLSVWILLVALAFVACDSKKGQQAQGEEFPVFEFSDDDSVTVNGLADQYVAAFNAKNMEEAANMLYTVRNDSVFPLTDEQRTSFMAAMGQLPHFGVQKKEVKLRTDLDNQVRIAVLLAENGSLEDEVGTVNFVLNPVKVQGQWYLTVYDKYAEGVGRYPVEE